MLSSRNRSLKRRSRFVAAFVIVTAGCYHRLKQIWNKFKDYTTDDIFLKTDENIPPLLRQVYSLASEKS